VALLSTSKTEKCSNSCKQHIVEEFPAKKNTERSFPWDVDANFIIRKKMKKMVFCSTKSEKMQTFLMKNVLEELLCPGSNKNRV